MSYTFDLTSSPEERSRGHAKLKVIDIAYDFSWSTFIMTKTFLDQNTYLAGQGPTKEETLDILSDLLYNAFGGNPDVSLSCTPTGNQLQLKVSSRSENLTFTSTLLFDTYENIKSIVDEVKLAFQKKFGPVQESVQTLTDRVGAVEAMFARVVMEQSTAQSTALPSVQPVSEPLSEPLVSEPLSEPLVSEPLLLDSLGQEEPMSLPVLTDYKNVIVPSFDISAILTGDGTEIS